MILSICTFISLLVIFCRILIAIFLNFFKSRRPKNFLNSQECDDATTEPFDSLLQHPSPSLVVRLREIYY